jgi:protein NirF
VRPLAISAFFVAWAALGCNGTSQSALPEGGVGSRVFVVERETESLAVVDIDRLEVVGRVEGLGNMRHAVMVFTPDLKSGYLATRSGQVSRIDLETLERSADVFTSMNTIAIAVSQDGRWIGTAEYHPPAVTILDAKTSEVVARHPGVTVRDGEEVTSRVTGIVDAPGNRFVCVLMDVGEIWVIDASRPDFPIEHRVPIARDEAYDALITADGHYYVVGHMGSEHVSVLDLRAPEKGVREVSLVDPSIAAERRGFTKVPHLASWTVARDKVFVPLVAEKRLAVLDRWTWEFIDSVPLVGDPLYAIGSPLQTEVWVSFSGEGVDGKVQVIDVDTLEVKRTLDVGERIYHMDFAPRGGRVLISSNAEDTLFVVDARTYEITGRVPIHSPSGIYGPWRAFVLGL